LRGATVSGRWLPHHSCGNRQRKMAPSPFLFNKPIIQGLSFSRYSSTTLRNPLYKFTLDLNATYSATRTNHTLVTYICRWGHFSSLVTSQNSMLKRTLLANSITRLIPRTDYSIASLRLEAAGGRCPDRLIATLLRSTQVVARYSDYFTVQGIFTWVVRRNQKGVMESVVQVRVNNSFKIHSRMCSNVSV
jgi:hypothetical protein